MRITRFLGTAVALLAVSAEGCSFAARDVPPPADSPQSVAQASHIPAHRPRAEALVYVADFGSNSVTVYRSERPNPHPIETLTNGVVAPAAVWVDAESTLYVANDFGSNSPYKDTITEFPPGSTSPLKVLTGTSSPGALAVDAQGTVFVEDQNANVIDVYENGSTMPTRKITGVGSAAYALTVDEAGNLYAVRAEGERCRSDVVKIPPGANGGRSRGFKVPGCAYGIALDAAGNLYLAYFGDNNISAVNVYQPGARVPFRRILQGVNAPFRLAFDRDGSLYVPNDNSTSVTVYPKGSDRPSITISSRIQNPFGVAISPAAPLPPSRE